MSELVVHADSLSVPRMFAAAVNIMPYVIANYHNSSQHRFDAVELIIRIVEPGRLCYGMIL